jgi:hypothetical protein
MALVLYHYCHLQELFTLILLRKIFGRKREKLREAGED